MTCDTARSVATNVALLLALQGCFLLEKEQEIKSARKAAAEGRQDEAIVIFRKVIKKNPGSQEALDAAREGSRLSFLEKKDYPAAIEFYRYLVRHSDDEKDRIFSQRRIAEIYFERMGDYDRAISEINVLLEMPLSPTEEIQYRATLAKAYFYRNMFSQAEAEAKHILEKKVDADDRFRLELLLANVLFATRQLDQAIGAYRKLMASFPKQSEDENIAINLALCYEEKNEFQQARAILETLPGTQERKNIISQKIKSLQEREAQLPGAGGLKK